MILFSDPIYPIELGKKDTTDTDGSASYLDLHIERLKTKLYDKRDDFDFHIMNFPFTSICSNIIWSIYLSLSDIPELVVLIGISLIEGCC